MSEVKTEADFAAVLNTVFRVNAETPRPVELKLVEVNHRESDANEEKGMERFSLVFAGPNDMFLPQQTYPLINDGMGELALFLVPIARDSDGFRYEAVFNYYKT